MALPWSKYFKILRSGVQILQIVLNQRLSLLGIKSEQNSQKAVHILQGSNYVLRDRPYMTHYIDTNLLSIKWSEHPRGKERAGHYKSSLNLSGTHVRVWLVKTELEALGSNLLWYFVLL